MEMRTRAPPHLHTNSIQILLQRARELPKKSLSLLNRIGIIVLRVDKATGVKYHAHTSVESITPIIISRSHKSKYFLSAGSSVMFARSLFYCHANRAGCLYGLAQRVIFCECCKRILFPDLHTAARVIAGAAVAATDNYASRKIHTHTPKYIYILYIYIFFLFVLRMYVCVCKLPGSWVVRDASCHNKKQHDVSKLLLNCFFRQNVDCCWRAEYIANESVNKKPTHTHSQHASLSLAERAIVQAENVRKEALSF